MKMTPLDDGSWTDKIEPKEDGGWAAANKHG